MESGNILVFTQLYVQIYDGDFQLLGTIEKRQIHEHLWRIIDVQPYIVDDKHDGFILACEMKNFFKPQFKKKQPSHVYQGKKTDPSWVLKCQFNADIQTFDYPADMSSSMLIIDHKVHSVCETLDGNLFIKL